MGSAKVIVICMYILEHTKVEDIVHTFKPDSTGKNTLQMS